MRKFWYKIENLRNFSKKNQIYSKIWFKSNFFENSSEVEIFLKFDQNRKFSKFLKFCEICDHNRNFLKIWLKSNFFEILEKKSIRKFWPAKKEIFEKFSKIEIFRKFDQNRNFSIFWKEKSKILEKFDYGQLSK